MRFLPPPAVSRALSGALNATKMGLGIVGIVIDVGPDQRLKPSNLQNLTLQSPGMIPVLFLFIAACTTTCSIPLISFSLKS